MHYNKPKEKHNWAVWKYKQWQIHTIQSFVDISQAIRLLSWFTEVPQKPSYYKRCSMHRIKIILNSSDFNSERGLLGGTDTISKAQIF